MERFVQLLDAAHTMQRPTVDPGAVRNEEMNNAKLTNISNIKVYLRTFERLGVVFDITKTKWLF